MKKPTKNQFIMRLKRGISTTAIHLLSKTASLFVFLFMIVFSVSTFAQMTVKDSDNHTLMEVNDEGVVGSILLPQTDAAPSDKNNKLYNVLGNLYWDGKLLSTGGGDNLGDHTATQNINLNGNWLSGNNDNDGIFIGSNNNMVGIKRNDPKVALDVNGWSSFTSENSDGVYIQGESGDGIIGFVSHNRSTFNSNIILSALETSMPTKLRIGSALSPEFTLHVKSGTGGKELVMFHNSSKTSDSDVLILRAGPDANPGTSVDYLIIQDGDGTTIGTIDGNGSGGVRYNTTSDARLKTKIRDFTGALTTISKIKVRKYEMKSAPGKEKIGMIAQELQKVYPYAVSGSPDSDVETDPMMIDYGKLTPLLVRGIQELKAEYKELQKLNSKLLTENKELRQEIVEIKSTLNNLVKKDNASYVKMSGLDK